MLSDMYCLIRPTYEFNQLDDLVRFSPSTDKLVVNPREYSPAKFHNKMVRAQDELLTFGKYALFKDLPAREYLGSSWKPPETISEEQARTLLESGYTPTELLEVYRVRGCDLLRLAGIAAHITRRQKKSVA